MEPCKEGKSPRAYKWCQCMKSCGDVERIYTPYKMNKINGLHLIAELYDDDAPFQMCRTRLRWRTTWLTEDYWAHRRHWILFPQFPYGYQKTRELSGEWIDEEVKLNYNHYLMGKDPKYWLS